MYATCVVVLREARRGPPSPWSWSYRILGPKVLSSGRAASTLANHLSYPVFLIYPYPTRLVQNQLLKMNLAVALGKKLNLVLENTGGAPKTEEKTSQFL